MDEKDFLSALSENRFPKTEASEYFTKMRKEAGAAKELLGKGVEFASKNKAQLIGSALGAGVAAAYQYLGSKPGKTGVSQERASAEKNLTNSTAAMDKMQAEGKQPGYVNELGHARTKGSVEVAKANEKHPGRSALLAAGMGAAAGGGLASIGKRILG